MLIGIFLFFFLKSVVRCEVNYVKLGLNNKVFVGDFFEGGNCFYLGWWWNMVDC